MLTYSHLCLSLLPVDIITIIIMNCFRYTFFFPFYISNFFLIVREGKANVGEDILFIARLIITTPSHFCKLPISHNFHYI